MTTLLPDLEAARTTRLNVECVPGGRVRVLGRTSGDASRPALRPMLVDSGVDRATVSLVPDGALLLAGDCIRLDVWVGRGARLDLIEPAGTVAYDMRGAGARWDVRINLAPAATLVWAGEPFVVSAGASVQRATTVVLGGGARLAIRETVVLGRHRERSGALDQFWHVAAPDGTELLVEEMRLDGSSHRPGILGGNRVLGSVIALGLELPADLCPDGRLDLETGGSVWRTLAGEAHRAVPEEAWRAAVARC